MKDLRTDVLVHGVACDKIHMAPEQLRQFVLEFEEGEPQSSSGFEFVQQVEIAVTVLVPSTNRTEHLQSRDAVALADLAEPIRVEGDPTHANMVRGHACAWLDPTESREDSPMALHITGDTAADRLLTDNPLALLTGMLLDQQVAMETAFAGPRKLHERIGAVDAETIAGYDPEAFVEAFRQTPAVHRFPGSMAGRVQTLCQRIVDEWGGDAAALWTSGDPDGREVLKRLKALPGFGEQKAKIFLALLGKQYGYAGSGWREACAPYGEDGAFRSVADIVSPESLAKVRETKKAMKAAAKA